MIRFSSYNHLSGCLSNGSYLLINTLSGAVEMINKDFADMINAKVRNPILGEEMEALEPEYVESLLDRGFLTKRNASEEIEFAKEVALHIKQNKEKSIDLVLVPNMNCNYRCVYCFERNTETFRQNRNTILTEGQIDMVFAFAAEHDIHVINLYGGEPLNQTNLSQVQYLCRKAAEADIRLEAISNGHDLHCFIPFLGQSKGKISHLQITIDGPKDIHDRRRIAMNGDSSFDHIVSNIKNALEQTDVKIAIRVNVDAANAERIEELIDYLKESQIYDHERCMMYLAPVTGICKSAESEYSILRKITALEHKYEKLYLSGKENELVTDILNALGNCSPLPRRTCLCSASNLMMIFSPDGYIYPCFEVVGNTGEASAVYDTDGTLHWNKEITEKWEHTHLQHRDQCISCKYALLCTGGCAWHYLKGVPVYNKCYQFEERLTDLLTNVGNAYFEILNA